VACGELTGPVAADIVRLMLSGRMVNI